MVLNHPPHTFVNFHVLVKQCFAVFAATATDGKQNDIVMLLANPHNSEARFRYLADAKARNNDLAKLQDTLDRLGWFRLQDSSGCIVNLIVLKENVLSGWEIDLPKNFHQLCMSIPFLKDSQLSLRYSSKKARTADYEAMLGAIGGQPTEEADQNER